MKISNVTISFLCAIFVALPVSLQAWGDYKKLTPTYDMTAQWQQQIPNLTAKDITFLKAVEQNDTKTALKILNSSTFALNVLLAANNIALENGNKELSAAIMNAVRAGQSAKTRPIVRS